MDNGLLWPRERGYVRRQQRFLTAWVLRWTASGRGDTSLFLKMPLTWGNSRSINHRSGPFLTLRAAREPGSQLVEKVVDSLISNIEHMATHFIGATAVPHKEPHNREGRSA